MDAHMPALNKCSEPCAGMGPGRAGQSKNWLVLCGALSTMQLASSVAHITEAEHKSKEQKQQASEQRLKDLAPKALVKLSSKGSGPAKLTKKEQEMFKTF